MLAAAPALQHDTDPVGIVGGASVSTCGWPTTVYTGGCTATLVHKKAISTAQHCGIPSSIQFGESAGDGPSVDVLDCVGDGSEDAMLCELAEEVTQLPVTPVLFGCEAEAHLVPGTPVVIAGFGQTSYGNGGGTKLWAEQTIEAVEPGRVIIGQAGDGTSPCPGDSGGPVFVQVDDGSWRVFGTVLGGTTGTPCNSAADFQRIDQVVGNFEDQTGLDITPCFDGQTGAWDPGPECGNFFAGSQAGVGTWSDWCSGTPASGYSDACGPAFGDGGGDDSGGSDGTGEEGGSDGGGASATDDGATLDGGGSGVDSAEGTGPAEDDGAPAEGTGAPASGTFGSPGADDADAGCGCNGDPRRGRPTLLWLLLGLVGVRRR